MTCLYRTWNGWGETDLDAEEVISARRKPRTDAKTFLEAFLAKGPQEATEVYKAAADEGISRRTLHRAKADLGVGSRRRKDGEGWEWVLPSKGATVDR